MRKIFHLLILLFFASCSGTYYSIHYPLSETNYTSSDNYLNAGIPVGWTLSNENQSNPNLLFYILRNDYKSIIYLKEIKPDRITENRILQNDIELLAVLSIAYKKEIAKKFLIYQDVHTFKVNAKKYSCFEYYENSALSRSRTIVFQIGNRFYECTATPLDGVWSEKDLSQLFSAMQSFIVSVKRKN